MEKLANSHESLAKFQEELQTTHSQFINETRTIFQNQGAYIRRLETLVRQITWMLSKRHLGDLLRK